MTPFSRDIPPVHHARRLGWAQRVKCIFGLHALRLVATDSRCVWTIKGMTSSHIHLSFYACDCCGKRTASKLDSTDRYHSLAPVLVDRWVRSGHLDDRVERIHAGTGEVHTLRLVKS